MLKDALARPRRAVSLDEGALSGALRGPSWQDPTAVEIGAEEEGRAGRNVPLAALTGVGLAGAAIVALSLGALWFSLLVGAAVVVGLLEFYTALRTADQQPATAIGIVGGALVLAAAYLRGEAAMLSMLPLAGLATFLWFMASPPTRREGVIGNIATTVFGIAYIAVPAGLALDLLQRPGGWGPAAGPGCSPTSVWPRCSSSMMIWVSTLCVISSSVLASTTLKSRPSRVIVAR